MEINGYSTLKTNSIHFILAIATKRLSRIKFKSCDRDHSFPYLSLL